MKRSFLFGVPGVVAFALMLIAATYGLVRLAFGLLLPDIQNELGFSADVAGAISAGGSALYVVGALVGFFAAGAPRVLVATAAGSAALGAAGMALATDTVVFAVAAAVGSAGAGFASPGVVGVLRSHPGTSSRPALQDVANSGTGPGLVAAGLLALALLPDWRIVWAVAAVVAVIAGVGVLLTSRSHVPPRGRPAVPPGRWFLAHARPIAAALALGAGSAAVWTFGRIALVDAGLDAASSAVAWIALGAGGAVVAFTSSRTVAWGPRRVWVLTGVLAAVATVSLPLVAESFFAALGACVVFGWSYTAATGALIGWTSDIDAERPAAGTALLFVVLVAGQGAGAAALGGLVEPWGYAGVFAVASLVLLVATLGAVSPRGRESRALPPVAARGLR